jgi:hypothetical protein
MTRPLTATDRWLLGRIQAGDVTWRTASGGVSYRVWVNEDTTETVTRRARRLVDAGLARRRELTWRPGRGWVELTRPGDLALTQHRPDAPALPEAPRGS